MKISKVVLAAITATVIVSSCTKEHDVKPTSNPQSTSVDTLDNSNHAVDTTFQCPACGMG